MKNIPIGFSGNQRLVASAAISLLITSAHAALDTNRIEQLTGLKGAWNTAEGVFKITQPRNDLPVTVDGWKMPPFMGLTMWAAFIEGKKAEAMVAGDLVLFEDEVNPVMSAALEAGLSVTALHNHFFAHYWVKGKAESLARSLKKTLDAQRTVK